MKLTCKLIFYNNNINNNNNNNINNNYQSNTAGNHFSLQRNQEHLRREVKHDNHTTVLTVQNVGINTGHLEKYTSPLQTLFIQY